MGQAACGLVALPVFPASVAMVCRHVHLQSLRFRLGVIHALTEPRRSAYSTPSAKPKLAMHLEPPVALTLAAHTAFEAR